MKTRTDRVRFVRIARQRVRAFVRRAERAGAAGLGEVLTEGLNGSALRALRNGLGELDLIGFRYLMHTAILRS